MNCIITSAIVPIATNYNISTEDAKIATYAWMQANNTEEFDIKDPNYIKFLDNYFLKYKTVEFNNKRNFNKASKIWSKLNDGVLVIKNPEKFTTLVSSLNEAFGKDNIRVFKNANEEMCIKIAQPTLNGYTQEMLNIKEKAQKDGTFMKAPNGKPTNLTEKQWLQVRTKAFKDWFGDWENDAANASKVVDENGEPLVVYHGSVRTTKSAPSIVSVEYFTTPDIEQAATYTGYKHYKNIDRQDYIRSVFMNLKNPLILDNKGNHFSETEYEGKKINSDALIKLAKERGYDSFMLYNTKDFGDNIEAIDENKIIKPATFAAFDSPNQIKSATDNVGSFSRENDDIQYSVITEPEYKELLEELELSRETSEMFLVNFFDKVLGVKPKNKVDYKDKAFNYLNAIHEGRITTNGFNDLQKLYKKIFGYEVYDIPSVPKNKEEVMTALDKELENWESKLKDLIANDNTGLDEQYNEKRNLLDTINLLQRFLHRNLNKSDFTENEINKINKTFGDKALTKQLVGFKIQKLKEKIKVIEQVIAIRKIENNAKLIARKNRLVALKTIDNIKDIIRERISAEIDSRIAKPSIVKEKSDPFKKLATAINNVVESKETENRNIFLFKDKTQKEITYSELKEAILKDHKEFETLLNLFEKANPKLKIIVGGDPENQVIGSVAGKFHPKSNTLTLTNIADVYTAIHELAHSATYFGMIGSTDGVNRFDKKINQFMDYIRDYIDKNQLNPVLFEEYKIVGVSMPAEVYGFTNASEFIAELFGNPRFQEMLNLIPPMENKKFKSLLSEIWDAIVNFLDSISGNKMRNTTALDQAKKLGYASMMLQQDHIQDIYGQLEEIVSKLHDIQNTVNNRNNEEQEVLYQLKKKEDKKSYKVETYNGNWTRDEIEKQKNKVFLFGDNTENRLKNDYYPNSTQAVIRGLSNAIGIDTKKNMRTNVDSFFTDSDEDFNQFKTRVDEAIQEAIDSGKTIVLPKAGIGTGKADLPNKAPKLYNYLQQKIQELKSNSEKTIEGQIKDLNEYCKTHFRFNKHAVYDKNGNEIAPAHSYSVLDKDDNQIAVTSKTASSFKVVNGKLRYDPDDIPDLWAIPGSNLGNTVDNFGRDFLTGELKDSYPNLNNDSNHRHIDNLKADFQLVKNYYDGLGFTLISADPEEFPMVAKATFEMKVTNPDTGKEEWVTRTEYIGGAMDILGYNRETGEIRILDMKNKRSRNEVEDYKRNGSSRKGLKSQYQGQQNCYLGMLSAITDQIDTVTGLWSGEKCLNILQFNGGEEMYRKGLYTADDNGQLTFTSTGDLIQNMNDFHGPRLVLYDTQTPEEFSIPVINEVSDQIDGLTPEEFVAMYGPDTSKDDIKTKIVDEVVNNGQGSIGVSEENRQSNNLYNGYMKDSDMAELANSIIDEVSSIYDVLMLHNDASKKWYSLITGIKLDDPTSDEYKYYEEEITKMDRDTLMEEIPIQSILNYIKENKFKKFSEITSEQLNLKYADGTPIYTKEEIYIATCKRIAYENFDELVNIGNGRFMLLEGKCLTRGVDPEDLHQDGEQDININIEDVSNKDAEHWMLQQASNKASLSSEWRRILSKIKKIEVKEVNGETKKVPVKNKWNFVEKLNADVVINNLLTWFKECTNVDEMVDILEKRIEFYPEYQSILDLIKNDDQLKSKFFQNFRKDFNIYSITLVDYDFKTKKTSYIVKVINNSSAADYIMSDLGYKFATKTLDFLKNKDYGILIEKGKDTFIDRAKVESLQSELAKFDKIFLPNDRKTFTNKDNIKAFKEFLDKLGLNISVRSLSMAFNDAADNYEGTAYSVENVVSKTIGKLKTMLNLLHDRETAVNFSLFKEDPDASEISIRGFYKDILDFFGDYMEEVIEASTYENGKMHYSFNPPSYAGKLFINLKKAMSDKGKFDAFVNDEYGKYKWFNANADTPGAKENDWLLPWMKILYDKRNGNLSATAIKARKLINRKTQLSYAKTPYVELGGLNYAKSILSEFFALGKSSEDITEAFYRMPIMANKPASEFVSFLRFGGKGYKTKMLPYFYMIFTQELMRMRTVIERAENDASGKIKFYDLTDKWKNGHKEVFNKFNKNIEDKNRTRSLTLEDLKTMSGTGVEFKFLPFLNNVKNEKLKEYIIKYLNNEIPQGYDLTEVIKGFNEEFETSMQAISKAQTTYYKSLGMFDTVENIVRDQDGVPVYGEDGKPKTVKSFKHLGFLNLPDVSFEEQQSFAESELENFVWNDFLASINIIELTATDLAYYKNVEDFQKRFAQIHAPGLRLNIRAKALIGEKMVDELEGRVSDGWSRTTYIKDQEYNTGIEEDVSVAFDMLIANAVKDGDTDKAESLKAMKSVVKAALKGVNVADAQALTSPTGMMKKLTMAGSWTNDMTEAYNRICSGNFNLTDLKVLIQPLKPFVYSQIQKNSYANTMSSLKVGLQNKNSEYMILLSDAIMRGANKKNKLMALFDFMESSAYDGRIIYRNGNVYKDNIKLYKSKNPEYNLETVLKANELTVEKLKNLKDGTVINKGVYNGHGIDTIQFESAVKVGLQGVIDLNGEESEPLEYEDIIKRLKRTSKSLKSGDYNDKYVHTFSYEDYAIQQEVPAHLRDHKQLMGSQERILNISDMPATIPFEFVTSVFLKGQKGREKYTTAGEVIKRYQDLVAANIDESYKDLMEEFGLDKSLPESERNRIVSKLLLTEMGKDARYGADLRRACMIDDTTGKFIIPLSDPIQSMRIQQLIHSIIKSRINKQRVAGGPVVQTSAWGLSEKLRIRWKGDEKRKDNLLIDRDSFKPNKEYSTYEAYLSAKLKKLAYFECAAPVPSEKLERDLILLAKRIDGDNYNGRLATPQEAVDYGLMDDSQLRSIGYRIPTEDKYSMYPMKIVEWVPRSAGEVIILPEEITKLTGSDFDIDKTYVYLQECMRVADEDELKKLIKSKSDWDDDRTSNAITAWLAGEKTDDTSEIDKFIIDLGTKNKTKFVHYERINFNNRSGRNNEIFDIQWKMLTHPNNIDKLFNPGSFDPQKKTARIIQILKLDKTKKYKDLVEMDLEDLEDLLKSLSNNEDLNICLSATQVKFQQQNMTAGKLIGIFANNNVSHAFVQMQDIYINFNPDYTIEFCSVNFGKSMKIDDIYALSSKDYSESNDLPKIKTYISKNIAGFLAASVDAVKDPVLNYLNLNTFTSGVAMLLARLGFDIDSIGLFLAQPAIENAARLYANKNNDGYISIADAVVECLNDADPNWKTSITSDEIPMDINKDSLSNHINDDKKQAFQVECLKLFYKLVDPANALNDLTFLTKFNSVSNAAGPSIADTIILKRRKDRFDEVMNSKDDFHPFSDEALNVIENSPILKAFYNNTVAKTGAAEKIFKQWFPHYTDTFARIVTEYENYTKSPLDEKTLNKLALEFLLYKLTLFTSKKVGTDIKTIDGEEWVIDENGNKVCKITEENRKRFYIDEKDKNSVYFNYTFLNSDFKTRGNFINKFPEWFIKEREELRKKHPKLNDNQLLNIITLKTGTKKLNINTLEAKTGGFSSEMQEEIKNAWSELLENPDPRVAKMGKNLFYYCLFRNGFGFSPKTFIHLASVKTKLNIGEGYEDADGVNHFYGYIELINDLNFNEDFTPDVVGDFLEQFKRNHWKENRVVPDYEFKDFAKTVTIGAPQEMDGKSVISFSAKSKSDLSLLFSSNKSNPISMMKYDDKLYKFYKSDDALNKIYYYEIKPLGFQNSFLEYNMNESYPESAINESKLNDNKADNNPSGDDYVDNGKGTASSQQPTDDSQPTIIQQGQNGFTKFGTLTDTGSVLNEQPFEDINNSFKKFGEQATQNVCKENQSSNNNQ